MRSIPIFIILILGLLLSFSRPANADSPKEPVPPAAAQDASLKLLKDIYKPQYADTTATGRKKFAAELIAQAGKTLDDPAARFVMLREAKDAATLAGDAQAALSAIDQIDQAYSIDAPAMKAQVLIAMIPRASVQDAGGLALKGIEVLDQMIAAENFMAATKLVPALATVVGKAKDDGLKSRLREDQVMLVECEKAKAAIEKLKTDPADPAANLLAGKFFCLFKGDFEKGLPLLANSSDGKLKSLAGMEKAGPAEAMKQKELADAWFDYAQSLPGLQRGHVMGRAGGWYQKALPSLTGLVKVAVQKRLDQIGSVSLSTPAEAKVGEWVDLLKLVDPKDAPPGDWTTAAAGLSNSNGDRIRIIPFPVHCSTAYELQLSFMRTKGVGPIALAFPAGDGKAELLMSAWNGECSMIAINGQDLHNNATTVKPGTLQNQHEYKLAIRVAPAGADVAIDISLDGNPYMKYKGPQTPLAHLPGAWTFPGGKTVGFGAQFSEVTVTSAKMKSESGKITLLRQPAVDTTGWNDLLKSAKLSGSGVVGKWNRDDDQTGVIKNSPGTPTARLMLPAATEGSYDLQVKFIRHSGGDSPFIQLPVGSSRVSFAFIGYHETFAGLDLVDGKRPHLNPETAGAVHPNRLKNERETTLDIHVQVKDKDADITVRMDGEQYFQWTGLQSALSCNPLPDPHAFGLSTLNASITFSSVKVKMISGQLRESTPK